MKSPERERSSAEEGSTVNKCQMTVRHKRTRQEMPVCQEVSSEEVPELAVSARESSEGRAPKRAVHVRSSE